MYIPAILALTNILSSAPQIMAVRQAETTQNSIFIHAVHDRSKIAQQDTGLPPTKKLNINEAINKVKARAEQNHAAGNFKKEADDLAGLGKLYFIKSEARNGLVYLQSALEIHSRIDYPWGKCNALNYLGDSYKELGEYQKALEAYKQSISISQTLDKTKLNYIVLKGGIQGLALVNTDLGETKEVFNSYDKLIEMSKQYGYVQDQASLLDDIGVLYFSLGDNRKALDYFKAAIDLERSTKSPDPDSIGTVGSLKAVVEDFLYPSKELSARPKEPKNPAQQAPSDAVLIKAWQKSARQSRLEGDLTGELAALGVLFVAYHEGNNYPKMYDVSKRKLELQKSTEKKLGESESLIEIANVFNAWDRKQDALNSYNQALEIQRQLGVRPKEAQTLKAMGDLYQSMGAYPLSLESYNQALALYRDMGYLSEQNNVLNAIITVHSLMGDTTQSLNIAQNQLLPLAESTGSRFLKLNALYAISDLYEGVGDYEKALKLLKDSQNQGLLGAGDKDNQYRSFALFRFGSTYQAMKDYLKAQEAVEESIALSRKLGDQESEAYRLSQLGTVYSDWQKPKEAQKAYEQALPLFQKLQFRSDEAQTLALLASSQRRQGNLDPALKHIEAAIDIIEDIRQNVSSSDLRTSFLASKQGYYKLKIRVLMELHKQQPSKGYDALALETSERSRARSLLDLLAESRVNIRQGVAPDY